MREGQASTRKYSHQQLVAMNRALVRILPVLSVAVVGLALVFMQLGFVPVYWDNSSTLFHALVYFVPFVGAALRVTLPVLVLEASAMGVGLWIHAQLIPLDYYEMTFTQPILAVALSCCGTMVIWLLMNAAGGFGKRRGWDSGHPILKHMPFAIALLVASAIITVSTSSFLANMSYGIDTYSFGIPLVESTTMASQCIATLCNAALWFMAYFVGDALATFDPCGKQKQSFRSVFRRWLFLVAIAAFLVTTTIGYCLETARLLRDSDVSLTGQVNYLLSQVDEHLQRQEELRQSENDLVLSKARAAANLIEKDPFLLYSQDEVVGLADDLDLVSLTVCDETGLVVADSDGAGIGEYNFASSEQTARYLGLVLNYSSIIEEPRHSIDANGIETEDVRVFAGVTRKDAPGFVQVSIDAEAYANTLSAASLQNLVDSYAYGKGGIVFVSDGDFIVSSNRKELRNKSLSSVFLEQPIADFQSSQQLLQELSRDDVIQLRNSENMGIMYMKVGLIDDCGVFVLSPSSDIFENRTLNIIQNAFFYLVVLGFMFWAASALLDDVVVRGFMRTNDVLALITAGDLEQRVEEHETVEFDALSDGINTMVDALKSLITDAESRVERELATAKAIQESALPRTFPPFPEVEAFDIYASMHAAKEVGGDFYDFFLIDDHTLGFLIADVSGKGVPASLFMMAAKTQIENFMSTGMPLADAIQTANHHLCTGNDAGMFVTVWAGSLDYSSGELTYVNAGHNFPLLRHDGKWEWLKKKCGLFLGTFETAKYRQETIRLAPGDELILYTDGVNEAFNVAEEEYGNERLEGFLNDHVDLRPHAMVDALRADVGAWAKGAEQSDDITVLCLEYGVAPEVSSTITVPATIEELNTVRAFVHDELKKRFCPIRVQNSIDIALEELFVNVCRYAYVNQQQPGSVTVSYIYRAKPSSLTVQIDDTGIPFNPLDAADPVIPDALEDVPIGGLGIMMARRCVDDISYVYADGHNIVAFKKVWK